MPPRDDNYELISAWLDGELPGAEGESIGQLVADDPLCATYADDLRTIGDEIREVPQHTVSRQASARFIAAAITARERTNARSEPTTQQAATSAPAERVNRRRLVRVFQQVAAVLVVALVVHSVLRTDRDLRMDQPEVVPGMAFENVGLVPKVAFQKMFLVVDVTLTSESEANRTFEAVLNKHGIVFNPKMRADAELEQRLLDSRHFAKAEGRSDKVRDVTLVYVEGTGTQVDRSIVELQQETPGVSVTLDLTALLEDNGELFNALNRHAANQFAEKAGAAASRGIARKVSLQTNIARVTSDDELTLNPDEGADSDSAKPAGRNDLSELIADQPGGQAPEVAGTGGLAMGDLIHQVLFVVRQGD